MKPPTPKIKELASNLIGTSDSGVDAIDALSHEECVMLDHLAFNCVGCGWWCDTTELNDVDDDWLCDDCAADHQ